MRNSGVFMWSNESKLFADKRRKIEKKETNPRPVGGGVACPEPRLG